jgi:hypothetical protein
VFPVPATPAGADPEKVLFASAICAAAYSPAPVVLKSDKFKLFVGCRGHPPFDVPARFPDGTLPRFTDPDTMRFCVISTIQHGSFTRAGAEQAVVAFFGCKDNDSELWDAAFPGSAVLVEKIDGHWREVDDTADVNADGCQKSHRADGRDVLLCRSMVGAGNLGTVDFFFLLDFARPGHHAGTLATLYSDSAASSEVGKVVLQDVNGDGTPDLLVEASHRRGSAPKTKRRLELLSSGDTFAPSPATRVVLETWAAVRPTATSSTATRRHRSSEPASRR